MNLAALRLPTQKDRFGLRLKTDRVSTKSGPRRFGRALSLDACRAQLEPLPRDGETLHMLMGGAYCGWDVIASVQELASAPISEMWIATLGFNDATTEQLCAMLDAKTLGRVSLICSHYFKSSDPQTFDNATKALGQRGQTIICTRSHAKVQCLAIDRARYVIESSANLRSCNNLEQFTLSNSGPLFEFHREWMQGAIAETAAHE